MIYALLTSWLSGFNPRGPSLRVYEDQISELTQLIDLLFTRHNPVHSVSPITMYSRNHQIRQIAQTITSKSIRIQVCVYGFMESEHAEDLCLWIHGIGAVLSTKRIQRIRVPNVMADSAFPISSITPEWVSVDSPSQ